MKSATWLYNVKASLRRKAWFTALVTITLLFALTINGAMQAQNLLRRLSLSETGQVDFSQLSQIFGYGSAAISVPLLIGAFAAALIFFGYLHQGKQADFYHSLPISRTKLFLANYLAGMAAVILPWLVNELAAILIMVALGAGSYLDPSVICAGLGGHLLCFLAIYTLTALAMVFTGHRLVGGLLALVFLGYAPLAIALFQWLGTTFYPTWYSDLINWGSILAHSSPVARYISLMLRDAAYSLLSVGDIYALLGLIAVSLGLCLFFYQRRPSETAGRALAFPLSRIFFKYPLVLTAMAGMGMALYEIGNFSWGWYMIGVALGGFISAQMLEIINAFDFRAIRAKLLPLAACLILFAGGSLFCIKDVTGYNTYVPDPADVAQVEIVLPDTAITSSYTLYSYTLDSAAQRQADLRFLGESREVQLRRGLVATEAGIAAAVEIGRRLVENTASEETMDWQRNRTSAYLRYTLKDGSVHTRSYQGSGVYLDDIAGQLDAIYGEAPFRQGLYPLFDYQPEQVLLSGITVYEDYSDGYTQLLDNAAAAFQDLEPLLAAYQEELTAMTPALLRQETAVGLLEFRIYASAPTWEQIENNRLCRECSYPLYPSMTRTIAALAQLEKGAIQPADWLPRYEEAEEGVYYTGMNDNPDDWALMEKYGYGSYPAAATKESPWGEANIKSETITDPEHLRQLIDATYPDTSQGNVFHTRDQDRQLVVTYRNRYGEAYTQTRWFDLE